MENQGRNPADLPHLLSRVDPEKPEQTQALLSDELSNDAIALRLGRAFLLGRMHGFTKHQQDEWPAETSDECNLYAGGYQYDDQEVAPINPFDALKDHLEDMKEKLTVVKDAYERLQQIDETIGKDGLTLELVNEKIDLRFRIINHTVANIMERIDATSPVGSLPVQLMQELREITRRPHATDKSDASDHG